MSSELCKTCIHTKVCRHDKNLVGDVYVAPHPLLGHEYAEEAWKWYQEWAAAGFPCEDYLSADLQEVIHCRDCKRSDYYDAPFNLRGCAGRLVNDNDFCSWAKRRDDE